MRIGTTTKVLKLTMKKVVLFFLMTISLSAFSGEYTKVALIGELSFNNNAEIIYLYPESGTWTSSGCVLVTVPKSDGQNGFISIALAAKLAGKEVKFFGNCDAVSKQFTAHSIYIQ